MKARPPVKLMDVCDMKLTDEVGLLSRYMVTRQGARFINSVASEIVFQPLLRANLHLEFHLRDVTDGMRTFPLRKKIENALQPITEFSSLSMAIENVGLDALWLAC